MKFLLDTHVWIWWHSNPEILSFKVLSAISENTKYEEILLSAISIWEFCKLIEKKKIEISSNPENWINNSLSMPKLRLVPLTPTISYHSTTLPQPFHNDPADQIIVATAREENAIIITKDKLIHNYQHVRTFW